MIYRITDAPWFLYQIGVQYHSYGVITKGKEKLFDYYKTDRITDRQREKILAWCKDVKFINSALKYAPEIRSLFICFPKAAYYRSLPHDT